MLVTAYWALPKEGERTFWVSVTPLDVPEIFEHTFLTYISSMDLVNT